MLQYSAVKRHEQNIDLALFRFLFSLFLQHGHDLAHTADDLPGEHGEEACELTEAAGPPGVGVHDVDAAVVGVHGADDEQVQAHEEVGTTEVDDEERRRLRTVGAEPPDDDEQVAHEGGCPEHPDAHLERSMGDARHVQC